MSKILAVDDDKAVLALIKNILEKDGHIVTNISDPSMVLKQQLGEFQLILLDVMMNEIDGFTLCKDIRSKVDCPILFLTAKSMENDIMYGFRVGADDYILKPFGSGELRARINAHLRRENRQKRNVIYLGNIQFNLSGKEITIHDKKVSLTKSEYEICEFLVCNRGQVFSKERIYEAIFGFDGESEYSVVVEHIKNIRAKFSKFKVSPIETVWGIGYKWI
ncbi:response regulator transcription factor [Clostridium uliginosum]|uniref:Stage 0 sporulation protein A homolog n=1 Tax=Clostridium uliginosum TaxID=119641 RepID=A0A1I1R290_9CLOT|nr:response regulator transcription factor [Clostridium uliginosum]SFD28486.1 DNA-binding response regulator, OmpR family, contains REC and winged-helix (wHTH) domain [Clostridium uliginosum]